MKLRVAFMTSHWSRCQCRCLADASKPRGRSNIHLCSVTWNRIWSYPMHSMKTNVVDKALRYLHSMFIPSSLVMAVYP